MRLALLLLLTSGLMLLVGDAGGGEITKKSKLEGTWKAVSGIENGKEQKDAEEHYLTFAGKTFSLKKGDKVMVKGTFKTDTSKKPHQIDMTITEGPEKYKDKTSPGIYSLKGDTLKWCASEPGRDERPTDFTSVAGSHRLFITLMREKK